MRARQSTSSFHPVPSSEAALAFSADSLELGCLSNKQWKQVGVEVSYPVTADMFEITENDWLATASSRARARVEVNIKKLYLLMSLRRHSQTASHDDALGSHLESG